VKDQLPSNPLLISTNILPTNIREGKGLLFWQPIKTIYTEQKFRNQCSLLWEKQRRRKISSGTIRANYTLLLERMAQVGAGAGRAESRREWVRAEEEKMKRDRQAQWLSRVRGVGLVHKGRFFE
jgi:hypothetical protein